MNTGALQVSVTGRREREEAPGCLGADANTAGVAEGAGAAMLQQLLAVPELVHRH